MLRDRVPPDDSCTLMAATLSFITGGGPPVAFLPPGGASSLEFLPCTIALTAAKNVGESLSLSLSFSSCEDSDVALRSAFGETTSPTGTGGELETGLVRSKGLVKALKRPCLGETGVAEELSSSEKQSRSGDIGDPFSFCLLRLRRSSNWNVVKKPLPPLPLPSPLPLEPLGWRCEPFFLPKRPKKERPSPKSSSESLSESLCCVVEWYSP